MHTLDINSLLANITDMHGQHVQAQGLLLPALEGYCLTAQLHEENTLNYQSAIFLYPKQDANISETQIAKLTHQKVLVAGTIYGPFKGFAGCGHIQLWAGEFAVTDIESLGTTTTN